MAKSYEPPFTLNPALHEQVEVVTELLGRWAQQAGPTPSPRLRRSQRIRSIQASLAIENNSLTVEQVTAVLDGKPVLAPPRDVQEVRNAFAAYERLPTWRVDSIAHLLQAHAVLMSGLLEAPGRWRSGGVGIYRGKRLVHMAPPASRVPVLMRQLLRWLGTTQVHPLVASSAFHYEFEFIHPFGDGNGRMGRLWQTLVLGRWAPVLAWLPVETVIRARQQDYYAALAAADAASDATVFIEFMLDALAAALQEAITSAAVSDQVTDQVASDAALSIAPSVERLLSVLKPGEQLRAADIMARLGLRHAHGFRTNYLRPALAGGWLEMDQPDSPRSPTQTYRRTSKALHR